MKVKYIFLSAIASVVALSSCSDALDMAPAGYIDMSTIWQDNDRVGAYLNAIYSGNYITDKGIGQWYFTTNTAVAMSDDAWDADAEVETALNSSQAYNGIASASNHPLTRAVSGVARISWGNLYGGIRKCNVFLTHIDSATVTEEKNRARWKAEAYLLRAYFYAELIRYYGSMAPIIKTATAYTDDFEQYAIKSTYRELVESIIADCDSALAEPAVPWRITTGGESNRVTKALACALKSRYSLYAASPLNATNALDAMTWEEAYQINKEALASLRENSYELYKTCKNPSEYDVFATKGQVKWKKGSDAAAAMHEYFCSTLSYDANPNDKETIWQDRGARGDMWFINGIGFQGYYKCGLTPTQELVDQYENVKYNSSTALESYPVVDLALPYRDNTHLNPNFNPENTIFDQVSNPYGDRDPRFYVTVVYNECVRTAFWKNEEIDGRSGVHYVGNAIRSKTIWTNKEDDYTGIHSSRRQRTRTGYYLNKYLRPSEGENAGGSVKGKIFRLAEIILNTAECAINAGHIQEGMTLVNEIRDRAGMPAWPTSLTQDEALLYLKHERRVEMAMEDTRLDDMRRWQRPDGDMLDYQWPTAMEISWLGDDKEGKPMYTYTRKHIRNSPRRCYSNKWLWVPIPLSDQNRLETLTGHAWQNPGW